MAFRSDKFERAKLAPRRETVAVPSLAQWFDAGEAPEFTVRGLSSNELHVAMDAASRQKNIDTVVRAIAAEKGQVDAIRSALGIAGDTPGEIAKRLEMMVAGVVEPKLTMPAAVKIAENFPIEFLSVTNKITELTGLGSDMVKPAPALQATPA